MKASCSMFSQILKLIPRTDFEHTVMETGAGYRSTGLSSWSQFVDMRLDIYRYYVSSMFRWFLRALGLHFRHSPLSKPYSSVAWEMVWTGSRCPE